MDKERAPGALIYVNDSMDGFYRRGDNPNFIYVDKQGNPVEEEKTIERIIALVIPPDWKNVWICKKPYGHIQATGRDSKGRKQYIYHKRWIDHLSRQKFESLRVFGEKLK